jgi:hypothetical protein
MKTELELELHQIAGYLPYGMYYQYPIIPADWDGETKLKTGIDVFDFGFHYSGISDLLYYKPVLRPVNDLYRTIIHNGKEIIPIVECAKIHSPALKWKLFHDMAKARLVGMDVYFSFGNDAFYSDYDNSIHQYQLFDYLNELKIDYRQLIDNKLAVSVYDLEENPYK